jgi:molybdate transport system substrate-binding protein
MEAALAKEPVLGCFLLQHRLFTTVRLPKLRSVILLDTSPSLHYHILAMLKQLDASRSWFLWFVMVILVTCTMSNPSNGTATDIPPTTDLTVFAAASLTEAFQEIGQAFEAAYPGTQVTFNFAGSQQLALQIEQGAQADVFASANQHYMDQLVTAELVATDAPATFARNQMVVILPAENPGQIETLHDLTRPGLKLILAGEQVPVGAYARQVLDKLSSDPVYGPGYKEAVLANVISNEENVRQVVAKVQLGEADAGIVYRSNVTPALAGKLGEIDIPDRFNVTATYPISVLKAASDNELAQQFVQFVLGPEGQRILERWGFIRAIE